MTTIRQQITRLREAIRDSREPVYSPWETIGLLRARCEEAAVTLERLAERYEPVPDPDRDRELINKQMHRDAMHALGMGDQ